MKKPGKAKLIEFYTKMVRIRKIEQKLMEVFSNGEIPGFIHVSIGQEAAPVGICSHLSDSDYISTTHRGHGHALAKGIDLKFFMAELFGKREGYCLGRSGSMHLADKNLGIMGANGIVGGGIPIATGAALAAKYKKTGQVVVATFGEGATSEGVFHEALNIAAIHKLPIVYACENNEWAEFSPQRIHMSVKDVKDRAAAYAIPGVSVSNDVLKIYEEAGKAIKMAREGRGPTLLEIKSERWYGHYVGDAQKYRGKEKVAEAMKKDCLLNFEKLLLKDNVLQRKDIDRIEKEIQAEINEAVDFARGCSPPDPSEMMDGLYV
ncbi:MAG: thiamine pyrophosphate-dependent dehydrogenase E1 component subunit alpha [Deltaproteobacteria bacterium]|nr:thiamine pyrophosphate-dependent dehydrogenase E1 component subunit alpha [Deltaproteobacteria bacterium]